MKLFAKSTPRLKKSTSDEKSTDFPENQPWQLPIVRFLPLTMACQNLYDKSGKCGAAVLSQRRNPSLDVIENDTERAVKVSHPSAMTRQTVPLERLSFFIVLSESLNRSDFVRHASPARDRARRI